MTTTRSAALARGDTRVQVVNPAPEMVPGSYLYINPYTIGCEIKRIVSVKGDLFTVSPLTNNHGEEKIIGGRSFGESNYVEFGADPTFTRDSGPHIQAAHDQARINGFLRAYMPDGWYMTNQDIFGDTGLTIIGDGAQRSAIVAGLGYVSHGPDSALLRGRRWDGERFIEAVYGSGPTTRLNMRHCALNGGFMPGANGLLGTWQQMSHIYDCSFINFPGYGLYESGQHLDVMNISILWCGIGLVMRNMEFGYHRVVNIEHSTHHHVLMEPAMEGGTGCIQNSFIDCHFEGNPTGAHFRMHKSFDTVIENPTAGCGKTDFVHSTGRSTYKVKNVRFFGVPTLTTAIRDEDAKLALNAADYFGKHIDSFGMVDGGDPPAANKAWSLMTADGRGVVIQPNKGSAPTMIVTGGVEGVSEVWPAVTGRTKSGHVFHGISESGSMLVERKGSGAAAALHVRETTPDGSEGTTGTVAIFETTNPAAVLEVISRHKTGTRPALYVYTASPHAENGILQQGGGYTLQTVKGQNIFKVTATGQMYSSAVVADGSKDGKVQDIASITSGVSADGRSSFWQVNMIGTPWREIPVIRTEIRDNVPMFGVFGKVAPQQGPYLKKSPSRPTVASTHAELQEVKKFLEVIGFVKEGGMK